MESPLRFYKATPNYLGPGLAELLEKHKESYEQWVERSRAEAESFSWDEGDEAQGEAFLPSLAMPLAPRSLEGER